jgi:hypothetical protein
MSRAEDRIGKAGQEQAAGALSRLGVNCVEPIATPIKAIPKGTIRGQTVYQVIWGEPVSGDHHGILPGGRGVLAETKTIRGRNLVYSDLRPHQPGALTRWAESGGLSLLVWVSDWGIFVMQWPIEGFRPGKGITREWAESIEIRQIWNGEVWRDGR